jgi:hypothetical protein
MSDEVVGAAVVPLVVVVAEVGVVVACVVVFVVGTVVAFVAVLVIVEGRELSVAEDDGKGGASVVDSSIDVI